MHTTNTPATTILSHVPGYPRIGAGRELKFALEDHWRGDINEAALHAVGRSLRARHWASQQQAGLDFVSVGDFAYYDQVANHIQLLGCEPARYGFSAQQSPLSRYFAMARGAGTDSPHSDSQHNGAQTCDCQHDGALSATAALEMSKWFDTNYHYLVPEFTADTAFSLASQQLFEEVAEAQALGHAVKAVILGPLSFLWLGKVRGDSGFDRLALLERLLPVYGALLARLKQQGVSWVQIDEPILGLDLPAPWRNAFETAYWQLNQAGAQLLLATYFSPLEENLSLACRLPVAGLHVDGVRAPHELTSIADWLPVHKVLSVGIVDGRNIWRCDLDAALAILQPLLAKRQGKLWLAASCSLLHVPYTLDGETTLDAEVRPWRRNRDRSPDRCIGCADSGHADPRNGAS
jgi:5-methyltetrahydropteroyltriglutamate--homocysteine methyltransferase